MFLSRGLRRRARAAASSLLHVLSVLRMRELSLCCRLGGGTALASIRLSVWRVAPLGLFPLGLMAYPGFGRPCRATHPGLWRGRPYGALSSRSYGLPRAWSPLQGYAPWALEGSPLWGLTRPVVASRAKNTISSTRGHEPRIRPPRYCASIHGHYGISSQGTAVCAPKAPRFCSRVLRYFLPRHSSMRT